MLRQIINKEPQNIEAYDALADDELVTRKFLHSEQLCDTALGIPVKGEKSELLVTKASAEDNMDEYYKGLQTLDTLVKKHPDNKDAVFMYHLLKLHYKEYTRNHREDSVLNLSK